MLVVTRQFMVRHNLMFGLLIFSILSPFVVGNSFAETNHSIQLDDSECGIEYFSPAKLDDEIIIKTILSSTKNVSFTFIQSAILKNDEKQVLCKGQVYCGCISLKRNAPAKIPEELRVKMKSLVQNNV